MRKRFNCGFLHCLFSKKETTGGNKGISATKNRNHLLSSLPRCTMLSEDFCSKSVYKSQKWRYLQGKTLVYKILSESLKRPQCAIPKFGTEFYHGCFFSPSEAPLYRFECKALIVRVGGRDAAEEHGRGGVQPRPPRLFEAISQL